MDLKSLFFIKAPVEREESYNIRTKEERTAKAQGMTPMYSKKDVVHMPRCPPPSDFYKDPIGKVETEPFVDYVYEFGDRRDDLGDFFAHLDGGGYTESKEI